jgi:uncharacterized protein (TIGR03000 family)
MKKFIAAAMIACGLGLSAWVPPALAQRGGYRSGGGPAIAKPYQSIANADGLGPYGYGPYQGGNFRPTIYGDDVSVPDPLSDSEKSLLFPSPDRGGYYHSDVYQPSYGAAAYAILAASKRSGAVSRPAPANGSNLATIRISVPDANARVSFDDTPTQQVGTDRVFTSPTLELGKFYTYTVHATWQENGQEMTGTKSIQVQAGRTTTVDFRDVVETAGR